MCKHYLYVMIRVLRLDQNDPLVWQRALLTSEAEEVPEQRAALGHPNTSSI